MKKASSGDCGSALVPLRGRLGDSSTHLEMDTNLHPVTQDCLESAYGSVTQKPQQSQSFQSAISDQQQEMARMIQGSDRTLQTQ